MCVCCFLDLRWACLIVLLPCCFLLRALGFFFFVGGEFSEDLPQMNKKAFPEWPESCEMRYGKNYHSPFGVKHLLERSDCEFACFQIQNSAFQANKSSSMTSPNKIQSIHSTSVVPEWLFFTFGARHFKASIPGLSRLKLQASQDIFQKTTRVVSCCIHQTKLAILTNHSTTDLQDKV